MGFMAISYPMKVSFQQFMGHIILWQVFMENSRPMKVSAHGFMGHEILCDRFSFKIHESLNKRMHFHGKFIVGNTSMKFSFCGFQGPWNPFHGLFAGNSRHFHKTAVHTRRTGRAIPLCGKDRLASHFATLPNFVRTKREPNTAGVGVRTIISNAQKYTPVGSNH